MNPKRRDPHEHASLQDILSMTRRQQQRSKDLAPSLVTDDPFIVYRAAEEMHGRRSKFDNKLTLFRIIIRYGDALHFEAQGDHFRAAEAYSNAAEMIIEGREPSRKNLEWAADLIGRAKKSFDEYSSNPKSESLDGNIAQFLEMSIKSISETISELAAHDLPQKRD